MNRIQAPDQGQCKFCGKVGHGKNPNSDIRKSDCPAFGKKCKKCQLKGHFADMCLKKGVEGGDPPKDKPKTTAGANTVQLNAMKMSDKIKTGKISRVSQTTRN